MNFQKILVPIALLAAAALAYRSYGWAGVAAVVSVLVFGLLLHFSRMMQVLKRATGRPIGYVDSAVMLNAKLKPGVTLMHVIAMTRSLGTLQPSGVPQTVGLKVTEGVIGRQTVKLIHKTVLPEIYRWTDNSASSVTCTFVGGKLTQYALVRPEVTEVPEVPEVPPSPSP